MRFKIFTILLIILTISVSKAQQKHTSYTIKAGTYLSANSYISDFSEINGFPSCCSSFNYAFGFGYGLFTGVEYKFDKNILQVINSGDFLISFKDISANYRIEEKIGNIIRGNEAYDGKVEHILEPKISTLLFEPGLNFDFFENFPLTIRFGLQAGLLMGGDFYQTERIISPDWIEYNETRTDTKYKYESQIQDLSPLLIGVSVGADYKVLEFTDNLDLNTILKIDYGITNLVDNLEWKYLAIQAGISFDYKIPMPEDIPPIDAPLPNYPELMARPVDFDAELYILHDGKELNDNDTLRVDVLERKFINTHILNPIIYFYPNSTELFSVEENKYRNEEVIQSNVLESIISYLRENSKVNVKLISSYLTTENPDTISSRTKKIKDYMNSEGISSDRIQINSIEKDARKLERKELQEDNCYYQFDFSNGDDMLTFWSDTSSKRLVEQTDLSFEIITDSKNSDISYEAKLFANDELRKISKSSKFECFISEQLEPQLNGMETVVLSVNLLAKDVFGKEKKQSKSIFIIPELKVDRIYENVISDIYQENYVQQLMLGYCEFDKSEFSSINESALNIIKEAIIDGKLIEIIPLFDFLGSEEHNTKLAMNRANSALKLLNLSKDDAQITIPDDYFFSNETPYGRMMNRTVVVRIKDIN